MTPAPCPECGDTTGHWPACKAPYEAEVTALRARVAELEAQHDNAGDLFASGRRYERALAGLQVERAEERATACDAVCFRQATCIAELEAVIDRARELANWFAEHASLIRSAYAYNDYDRGRTIALEDAHKLLLEALLPKESP